MRKFKATFGGRQQEFDMFYNPSVRISPDNRTVPGKGARTWVDLARRCLRFERDERPPNMEALREELSLLIQKFPLQGNSKFEMNDNLVAATFVDGSDRLARLISVDEEVEKKNIDEEVEKKNIMETLEEMEGNVMRAAELLDVSRMTILNKMDRYGIPRNYGKRRDDVPK